MKKKHVSYVSFISSPFCFIFDTICKEPVKLWLPEVWSPLGTSELTLIVFKKLWGQSK